MKSRGNPNWGGAREESRLIEKYANQWCEDNGYPIQKRKYVYKGKWRLLQEIKEDTCENEYTKP